MKQIIENHKKFLAWKEKNSRIEIWKNADGCKALETLIQQMDEAYGENRKTYSDLGGYTVIFYGCEKENDIELEQLLEKYILESNEYEFEDVFENAETKTCLRIRLYICSADYQIIVVLV